ncbi:Rik1-associated factor 1 [Stagonosporopsis vannaccii]|nr:Rik1-associated factor 1 [Stagonosporopsis vannaccii]
MALSDNNRVPVVVDLTNDSESDSNNGGTGALRGAAAVHKPAMSPSHRDSRLSELPTLNARKPSTATLLSGSYPTAPPSNPMILERKLHWTPDYSDTLSALRRPSTFTAPAGMTCNAATSNGYAQAQTKVAGAGKEPGDVGRSIKRRRTSISSRQSTESNGVQTQFSAQSPENRHETTATTSPKGTQTASCNSTFSAKLNTMSGPPSVHYMNSVLRPSGSSSFLSQISPTAARPLLFNYVPQENGAIGLPLSGSTTSEGVEAIAFDINPLEDDVMETVQPLPPKNELPVAWQIEQSPKSSLPPKPTSRMQNDDRDSVVLDLPVRRSTPRSTQRRPASPSYPIYVRPPAPVQVQPPKHSNSTLANTTNKADHLLIFLKEVKKLKWADITKEFQKDVPGRSYVQLQSRYSQVLNKRDRTQDPPTLALPPRYAAEATIDWETVHANTERPRAPIVHREATSLEAGRSSHITGIGRPRSAQRGREDESSGTDSAPQRQRRRRAPPVNYTWPNTRTGEGDLEECIDDEDTTFSHGPTFAAPSRSKSPIERDHVAPDSRTKFHQRPLDMGSYLQDAQLGMSTQIVSSDFQSERVPYLSATQRLAMSHEAEECTWDAQNLQDWQSTVLHVDFSPAELQLVKRVIAESMPSRPPNRHSTYRRHLRAVLKGLSSPKLHKLAYQIRQHVRSRDTQSIAAFLQDAAAGLVADLPRVQRIAMIKPSAKLSSIQNLSVPSIVRKRELGLHSRRGWQTASTPLTYQYKNQMMDTIGPKSTWTGASSDIHTVAWSPNGQYFAAGAVAVTDPDSMQYNRPNVLMYGDTINGRIHELGEHSLERQKTEAGANSTHAMYVSQDPTLFTTVSSVAFSPSGNLLYSAGYDKTVCIWDVTKGSRQPQVVRQLMHKAPVDVLAVNPIWGGNFATATKRTTHKSIKLIFIEEESIYSDDWSTEVTNFASEKALSRPDLNMSANALKFDPTGRLLLAGFGANMREDSGLDTSGDICLWDVETQAALQVHGSSRNVFDVTFNPAPRNRALFAVGCVANGTVNRGTRSVVRFYSLKGTKSGCSTKFTCPLELECKAFDMNDVIWCPYDENLFAAGCTDGRSYIWDLRRPDRVLYTLSHGRSLMPLQDGVPHERTDTGVRFLSWGQNARRLYSGSSDGMIKVWDVKQAQEEVFIKDLVTTNSGIMSGAFTADYSKLVVGEVNGTANVFEVGRTDISLKDADKLQYQPYLEDHDDDHPESDLELDFPTDTAAVEARTWLNTGQLQLAPMGGLPRQQVIQGPKYRGPYDHAEDAEVLRKQALTFQRTMATTTGPQCGLHDCTDSINTTTHEEIGDSGRSKIRIPEDLRQQWLDETFRTVPGKSKCGWCSRPALPSTDAEAEALCERCSFTCFRCGAASFMGGSTSSFACGSCGGLWDIGALGYECVRQPPATQQLSNVPVLNKYGKEAYLERLEDVDTSFGDEMNALTDYYFGLAIDRPESPPL